VFIAKGEGVGKKAGSWKREEWSAFEERDQGVKLGVGDSACGRWVYGTKVERRSVIANGKSGSGVGEAWSRALTGRAYRSKRSGEEGRTCGMR
jgi:hypothetical protein